MVVFCSWTIMIEISLASFVIHEKNTISVGKSCKHLKFWFLTSKEILIWFLILAFYLFTEASCSLFVFSFPRIFHFSLSLNFFLFPFQCAHVYSTLEKNPWNVYCAYFLWFLQKTYFSLPLPLLLHFLNVRLLKAQAISEKFKGICHFYCSWFYFLRYQEIQPSASPFLCFLSCLIALLPTHCGCLQCLFLRALLCFDAFFLLKKSSIYQVSLLSFIHPTLYLSIAY